MPIFLPLLPLLPAPQARPVFAEPAPRPPVVSGGAAIDRGRLVGFRPGAVTCGGAMVAPTLREQPMPSVSYSYGPSSLPAASSYVVHFSIDAEGRPLDIAHDGPPTPGWVDVSDIMPAFAAWRFPAGAPHPRCSIAFAMDDQPIADAPAWEAARAFALPHRGNGLDRALFERTVPGGSTCFDPYAPPALVRVFPDFQKIPQPVGTRSYVLTGFDLDRHGRPIHVHVVSSDGNAALDRAALDAIRRSRFVDGARTGCTYPYHRNAVEPMAPPPAPDVAALRPADSNCAGVGGIWATLPPLTYPEPFRRRSIEGWAIVRYDIAPWGETGNVSVLRAEPAEAFGAEAVNVVRRATTAPSARGYTGCVDKVKFRMRPRGKGVPASDGG